jgi:hypothetical protein
MSHLLRITTLAILISGLIPAVVHSETKESRLLSLSAGQIGIFDDELRANQYGLEYRLLPTTKFKISPTFGVSWSVDNNQYIYTELKRDWIFKNKYIFTLASGIGLFNNSSHIDLGSAIEFRNGFEINYRFNSGKRLGIAAYHLSNSKISNLNPGTEIMFISYSVPLKN